MLNFKLNLFNKTIFINVYSWSKGIYFFSIFNIRLIKGIKRNRIYITVAIISFIIEYTK